MRAYATTNVVWVPIIGSRSIPGFSLEPDGSIMSRMVQAGVFTSDLHDPSSRSRSRTKDGNHLPGDDRRPGIVAIRAVHGMRYKVGRSSPDRKDVVSVPAKAPGKPQDD